MQSCLGQKSLHDKTAEDKASSSLVKEVEDNSRYKTLEANATLLKLLVDDKDGVSKYDFSYLLKLYLYVTGPKIVNTPQRLRDDQRHYIHVYWELP